MRAGSLGPMYFLDSVNMDVPIVAKQSEVGISYSGSVQLPSVPKKHLNIPTLSGNVSCQKFHSCRRSATDKACDRSGWPLLDHDALVSESDERLDELPGFLIINFGFLVRFPWFRVSMLIAMDEVNSCILR